MRDLQVPAHACRTLRASAALLLPLLTLVLAWSVMALLPSTAVAVDYGQVQGTVTDAVSGLPIADAYISVGSYDGFTFTQTGGNFTNQLGHFTVLAPAGTCRVLFKKHTYYSSWFDGKATVGLSDPVVVVKDAVATADCALQPAPMGTINGTATLAESGAPAYGAYANLLALNAGSGSWEVCEWAYTNSAGSYQFEVIAGEYKLHFTMNQCEDEWFDDQRSVETADIITLHDGETLTIDPALDLSPARARGAVKDEYFGALTGVTIEALAAPGGELIDSTVSDAEGRYELDITPDRVDRSFILRYSIAGGDYGTAYYQDKSDAASAQVLSVQAPSVLWLGDEHLPILRPAHIHGHVTDESDAPLQGISVTVRDMYLRQIMLNTVTDAAGSYDIEVPAGLDLRYAVQFTDPTGEMMGEYYDGQRTEEWAARLAVFPGASLTADAQLGLACTIKGTVKADADGAALPGVRVTAFRGDGTPAASTTTSAAAETLGQYSFELTPGDYYLRFGDPAAVGWLGQFVAEYYDNAADQASATAVILSAARTALANASLTQRDPDDPGPAVITPGSSPDGMQTAATRLRDIEGTAITTSVDTVAIGSKWAGSHQLSGAGAVSVYVHGASGWVLQQRLVSPDPVAYACFGNAVSLSGDTLAVGEFRDDGRGLAPGKVHVFVRRGGYWSLQQTLVAGGTTDTRRGFGSSVAASGDGVIVGAPYAIINGGKEAGACFVFTRTGDAWTQQKRLLSPSPAGDDFFGQAVALEGDRALVGASMDDTGAGVNAGSAHVFERTSGVWQRTATLTPADADISDQLGSAVALSGDTALVAAQRHEYGAGAAFVFVHGASGWTRQAELSAGDSADEQYFGGCLALSGDRALVGAPSAAGDGAAYSYRRIGAGWYQEAKLGSGEEAGQRSFGIAVGISGSQLLVGSARDRYFDETNFDAVRVYSPYWVESGTSLTVAAADGLLVNDVAPEGKTLTAEAVSQPAHGQLTLQADGSFVYLPDAAYLGPDTFSYHASCEGWQSAETLVTITVRDLSAPLVSIQDLPQAWVNHAVTVTLSTPDTDVDVIEYRRVAPGVWNPYSTAFAVARQGSSAFRVRARDVFGNAALKGFTLKIDTKRPTPQTLYAATVVRGRTATVKYKVVDARPGSPSATVTIRIRDARNVEKWRVVLKGRVVNKVLAYSFRCSLPRGTYRFVVTAVDTAGNPGTKAASNVLTVK